ncbi:uncharacterized protein CIMG_02605 [Coccidioides immitis RS]|uniref:Uncharacterized protein n=4 Tax=Coccidioides immitis TaxID=5501 RepID=A0A0E1S5P2_COCIM|nr:uncharacterized protein CIMG_02605 [Coccidioides immitis RS]EAS37251.2 hypothetical protein CIMG_02605 [Coccidioides immitis RS]
MTEASHLRGMLNRNFMEGSKPGLLDCISTRQYPTEVPVRIQAGCLYALPFIPLSKRKSAAVVRDMQGFDLYPVNDQQ